MWKHYIGYRHKNGQVEGFAGWSMINARAAQKMALNRLVRKLEAIGESLDDSKLAQNDATAKQLFSKEERAQIVSDWTLAQF